MKNLAMQAGAVALAGQSFLKESAIHTKGTVLDKVTDSDREVEEFIVKAIRAHFPEHGIYAEESGKTSNISDYCWIIDPIDGTTSFIHKLPNWAISIGLQFKNKPLMGVVYAPAVNELYSAERGKGAFLNGYRIHVSSRTKLSECVVATGFPCLRAQHTKENNLKFFNRIAPLLADIRRYGSASLDYCQVASGKLDGYWELFLEKYDIAAGEIILAEAGGQITDLFGGNDYPFAGNLASNGLIHKTLLSFFDDFQNLHA